MVDERQIKQWLADGTINKEQASKMLSDTSKGKDEERSHNFMGLIATIGAILIFVGLAWLVAWNWHEIPDFLKVIILVFATLSAFVSGVMLKEHEYIKQGRALINLGALLYVLSLFLIAQIYHLASSTQSYAWILLLAWTVILISAYFVDSPENLFLSIILFFIWSIVQYISSLGMTNNESGLMFGLISLFLSGGALLYGLSVLHSSLKHKFTNILRYWAVAYFLIIFFLLSFQSMLPVLSNYSFDAHALTIFLVIFVMFCAVVFIACALYATAKNSLSIYEIFGFLLVLIVALMLVLATKAGEGTTGSCFKKSCYDFNSQEQCKSLDNLNCQWKNNTDSWNKGYCGEATCYEFQNETICKSSNMKCTWTNDMCSPENFDYTDKCNNYNNQKDECGARKECKWNPSSYVGYNSRSLPGTLLFLWIVNNIILIGFIILIVWYGQINGSGKIVDLAIITFIIDIISRYIGFFMDLSGKLSFSLLAILGGVLLILGSWLIPKVRRKLKAEAKTALK